MKNEDASAGGIITLVFVFVLAGILFLLIGFAVDRIVLISLKMFTASGTSQLRYDVVNLMLLTFRAEPFIMIIGLGINHWVNALREFSGAISLSSLLLGASEMIILTLVIIALTLFGGQGIDAVINSVNNWSIVGATTELFGAVQYLAPVFYGLMFLILVGVVAQFVVLCVQVTDYSRSYTF